MIAKKEWDALPLSTKRQILTILYGANFDEGPIGKLLYEYRHNFDYDQTGKYLKSVLQHLYRTNTSNVINVRRDITYSVTDKTFFMPTPVVEKKIHHAPVSKTSPIKRRHWQIDYTDKSGDLCHIHCYADSKEEARDYLFSEYWDVAEVIQIIQLRD